MTPFCKVGGEEGLTEASGSATKQRKIFPHYSPPLQKGAAAIGGGGIYLHRSEATPISKLTAGCLGWGKVVFLLAFG